MTTALANTSENKPAAYDNNSSQFVTIFIGSQIFGIPVLSVQDVLRSQSIANIPLSRSEIKGLLNLRGRIVTAIDLRTRLKIPASDTDQSQYNVVTEIKGELYSLLVDHVGDVMTLQVDRFEKSPANLDWNLKEVSNGVYKLKNEIMIVLDTEKLINF